jgi:hypothetical protein
MHLLRKPKWVVRPMALQPADLNLAMQIMEKPYTLPHEPSSPNP